RSRYEKLKVFTGCWSLTTGHCSWEEVMKGRLSSTLTMLAMGNALALIILMAVAYSAGRTSGGLAIWDAFSAQGDTPMKMLMALLVVVLAGAAVFWVTGARVAKPVKELAAFPERLANRDYR